MQTTDTILMPIHWRRERANKRRAAIVALTLLCCLHYSLAEPHPPDTEAQPEAGKVPKQNKSNVEECKPIMRPAAPEDNVDAVISASEILDDNLAPTRHKPQGKQQLTLISRSDGDILAPAVEDANCSVATQTSVEPANGESDGDQESAHYLNARLLLRLLVVGLFVLVLTSLAIVYTIKFCLCNRRKRRRLLRHHLAAVADLAPAGLERSHEILLAPAEQAAAGLLSCSCHQIFASQASAANRQHAEQVATSNRLHSLLRPSLWNLCNLERQQQQAEPSCQARQTAIGPSVFQQLALAERLALQQLGTAPTLTSNACAACLVAVEPPPPQPPPLARPPAYSDLFGQQYSAPTSQDESLLAPQDGASLSTLQSSSPAVPAELASSSLGSQASELMANQSAANLISQRNLLVKLNLNKTRLLSAEDLMLLSKLIDVPIVVQRMQPGEGRARQQLGNDNEDQTSGTSSAGEAELGAEANLNLNEQQLHERPSSSEMH